MSLMNTQSLLQNSIAILILLETIVVQYESKRTTMPYEEFVLDSPENEATKEETTPRCKYMTHSHHSHSHGFNQHEEHRASVTGHPSINKWQHVRLDQPMSEELSSTFWNKENDVGEGEAEPNHDGQVTPDDKDPESHQHDSFYDLINHKFWAPDTAEWDRHRKQHEKQLDDNWKAWMKVVSYFPSGQQQLTKQIPLKTHNLAKSTAQNTANLGYSQPLEPMRGPTSKQLTPQLQRQAEEPVKETPASAAVGTAATKDDASELDQQDPVKMLEPTPMHYDEQTSPRTPPPSEKETQQERPEVVNRLVSDDLGWDVSSSTSVPTASAERARNSLLKAADIARHLNQRALNATTTTAPPITNTPQPPYSLAESSSSSSDTNREVWSADELLAPTSNFTTSSGLNVRRGMIEEDRTKPMFLGYGQVQRNEPFNGNMRTQARLSCQFGDATGRNLTISNVEWAKFKGIYDLDKLRPDFNCPSSTSCRVEPVRTDVSTTVHPRPAIQNYIDTLVPSYSVTLHDVSSDQLGVYRCSALRQMDGRKELVYRIIQFE